MALRNAATLTPIKGEMADLNTERRSCGVGQPADDGGFICSVAFKMPQQNVGIRAGQRTTIEIGRAGCARERRRLLQHLLRPFGVSLRSVLSLDRGGLVRFTRPVALVRPQPFRGEARCRGEITVEVVQDERESAGAVLVGLVVEPVPVRIQRKRTPPPDADLVFAAEGLRCTGPQLRGDLYRPGIETDAGRLRSMVVEHCFRNAI